MEINDLLIEVSSLRQDIEVLCRKIQEIHVEQHYDMMTRLEVLQERQHQYTVEALDLFRGALSSLTESLSEREEITLHQYDDFYHRLIASWDHYAAAQQAGIQEIYSFLRHTFERE